VESSVHSLRGEVSALTALAPAFATKADVNALRADVNKEMGALRAEMKEGFGAAKAETGELRADMNRELGSLRAEMKEAFGGLMTAINARESALIRWIVGTGIGGVSAAVAIERLFG
jgi:hypothetical protein